MFRTLARLLVVLGVSMPLTFAQITTTSAATSATPPYGKDWAATYMAWPSTAPTETDAVAAAKKSNLIIDDGRIKPHLPAMRAANPSVKVVRYDNGAFSTGDPTGTKFPIGYYAVDAAGERIRSEYGIWAMDIALPEWRQVLIDRCSLWLSQGFDGCFLDSLGTALFNPSYATGVPMDRRTGEPFTPSSWLAQTSWLTHEVDAALSPSALVITNGLAYGDKYFDAAAPTSTLATAGDGAMVEMFVRRSPTSAWDKFPAETSWKKDVDMLVDAGARGRKLHVATKLWSSATSSQQTIIRQYAFATFLLGSNGLSTFSMTTAQTWPGTTYDAPIYNMAIGTPTAAYSKSGGVYRRSFTNGLVLVNPTTTSATVVLGAEYVNISGKRMTQITLGPNRGTVLKLVA